MLKLTIETKDSYLASEIKEAYNKALETSNMESFLKSLDTNTNESIIVGLSGSHIWISDKETGKRLAIIII